MSGQEPFLRQTQPVELNELSGVINESRVLTSSVSGRSYQQFLRGIPTEPQVSTPNTLEHFLPLLTHFPPERLCFICLDGTESEEDGSGKLVSCCSQCYAVTHAGCWRDWRSSQSSNARRTRVSGNRLISDPFLCSICKSGYARIDGERVPIRWLEAFAAFGQRSAIHQVRLASGLFSALTGARSEDVRGPVESADGEDGSYEEEEFLDFVESEGQLGSRGISSTFFCGNTSLCVMMNCVVLVLFLIGNAIVLQMNFLDGSTFLVMADTILIIVYLVFITVYVFYRYQRILNQRHLAVR